MNPISSGLSPLVQKRLLLKLAKHRTNLVCRRAYSETCVKTHSLRGKDGGSVSPPTPNQQGKEAELERQMQRQAYLERCAFEVSAC